MVKSAKGGSVFLNTTSFFYYKVRGDIIGDTYSCMEFIQKNNYFICNTVLKEDIRKLIVNQKKIICILTKNIPDLKYKKITYINEKYKDKILEHEEIKQKISSDLLE